MSNVNELTIISFKLLLDFLRKAVPQIDATQRQYKKFLVLVHKQELLDPTLVDELVQANDIKAMRNIIYAVHIALPADVSVNLPEEALQAQDDLLNCELQGAKVVECMDVPQTAPNIAVWQGDMSILRVDAMVNPGNQALLGCFLPGHKCLDNILHAQSGPRLRIACKQLLDANNMDYDTNGNCRVTPAFALPAKCVFHTVGPDLVENPRRPPRKPSDVDRRELLQCYESCLDACLQQKLSSVAFCCISTGVFGYPGREAANLALTTTRQWMERQLKQGISALPLVVFNVFKDEDREFYESLAPKVFAGFSLQPGGDDQADKKSKKEADGEAEKEEQEERK